MLSGLSSPHPAWFAFVQPARFTEAKAALQKDPAGVLAARGQSGETVLHWAVMSDLGLSLDLLSAGMDPMVLDHAGMTPLDWLNNRLWCAVVNPRTRVGLDGADRILRQTERFVPVLWNVGFRPSGEMRHSMVTDWISAGAYGLLGVIRDAGEPGLGLTGFGPQQASLLHVIAVSKEGRGRLDAVQRLVCPVIRKSGHVAPVIDVDAEDLHGRTPLRYALQAWAEGQVVAENQVALVRRLITLGADPHRKDRFGVSPLEFVRQSVPMESMRDAMDALLIR